MLNSLWQQLRQAREFWYAVGGVLLVVAIRAYTYFSRMTRKEWSAFVATWPWWVLGLALVVIAVAGFVYWRNQQKQRQQAAADKAVADGPTVWLLPSSEMKAIKVADLQHWERLPGAVPAGEHLAWELSGNGDGQRVTLHASEAAMPMLLTQVEAEPAFSASQQRPADDKDFADPLKREGGAWHWIELAPAQSQLPIEPVGDPLRAAMVELAKLSGDVSGVVQVLARPDQKTQATLKQQAMSTRSQLRRVAGAPAADPGASKQARGQADVLDARAAQGFAECIVRVAVHADKPELAKVIAGRLAQAISNAYAKTNPLTQKKAGTDPTGLQARSMMGTGSAWGARELAPLAYIPGQDVLMDFPRFKAASAKALVADVPLRVLQGDKVINYNSKRFKLPPYLVDGQGRPKVVFGTNTDRAGNVHFVGIPLKDLTTHFFVIGSTGSGKSTALANIAVQTYAHGAGVFMLDPHGKLADDTALKLPDEAFDDVVFLDLSAYNPPAIPLFALSLQYGLDRAVDAAMSALKLADPANWDQSGQMQDLLRHALRIVLAVEGGQASMVKLDQFFNKSVYRDKVLGKAQKIRRVSRSVDYWETKVCPLLDPGGEGGKRPKGGGGDSLKQSLSSAARRLSLFVNDDFMRRTLSLPPMGPELKLGEFVNRGLLVLAPVRKSGDEGLGEKAWPVVLTLYMWLLVSELMGRDAKANNPMVLVLLDELAAMANTDVMGYTDTMLREIRKFNVGLCEGTQTLSQMPSDIKTNITANTNNKLVLRVKNPDDARDAVKMLETDKLAPGDVQQMPPYSGYYVGLVDNQSVAPTLVKLLDEITLDSAAPRARAAMPPARRLSAAFKEVMRLAPPMRSTNPRSPEGNPRRGIASVEAVVDYLVKLPAEAFDAVVADCVYMGQLFAAQMLNAPHELAQRLQGDDPRYAAAQQYAAALLANPAAIRVDPESLAVFAGVQALLDEPRADDAPPYTPAAALRDYAQTTTINPTAPIVQAALRALTTMPKGDGSLRSPAEALKDYTEECRLQRIQMISGGLYGLPWWLREAQFQREDRAGDEVYGPNDAPALDDAPVSDEAPVSPRRPMVLCPKCGAQNSKDAEECAFCDTAFSVVAVDE